MLVFSGAQKPLTAGSCVPKLQVMLSASSLGLWQPLLPVCQSGQVLFAGTGSSHQLTGVGGIAGGSANHLGAFACCGSKAVSVQFDQVQSCGLPGLMPQGWVSLGWCTWRSRSTPVSAVVCSHESSTRSPRAPTKSG